MTRLVNNPAVQERQADPRFDPGQEGLLEEGMAIHSSILAWRISRTEEPGRLQSTGSKKSLTRLSN